MITPGDGFVNPCASAWESFEKKRIVVSHRFSPARLVFWWGERARVEKRRWKFSRSRSLYQVYAQTVTRKQNAEKKRLFRRARGKRKSKRTGSTFCFLAFALPPPVCALAPLAPPAPDLPPPLVVVAAPDLPLAAAPLAASECAVNVSYTVGTSLILEKSASLCRREGKPDKRNGKHTHRQSRRRRSLGAAPGAGESIGIDPRLDKFNES